ncbi:uncharacterized protein DS421_17g574860 [Arachis hypogaea]|nr:uncharacterized protein DS421_17g574860 [Arachis hypogaea]
MANMNTKPFFFFCLFCTLLLISAVVAIDQPFKDEKQVYPDRRGGSGHGGGWKGGGRGRGGGGKGGGRGGGRGGGGGHAGGQDR